MMIKVMLITEETYFAELFAAHLSGVCHDLSVLRFTDQALALAYLADHPGEVDAVLAEEGFLQAEKAPARANICLSDRTECAGEPGGLHTLNIFQRRGEIVADLRRLLTAALGIRPGSRDRAGRVYAFYSSQGGSGKSTLAYLCALQASRRGRAAYLNLELTPGSGGLEAAGGKITGERLLIAVKERQEPAQAVLPALERNRHGVLVLPKLSSLRDRLSLTEEDVAYLIDALLSAGAADALFLDLPCDFAPATEKALELSDSVLLVYTDAPVGAEKRDRLLGDPNFRDLPFAQRYTLVGNRCRAKYTDGRYAILFPYSQSLDTGVDPQAVLEANPELAAGCDGVLATGQSGEGPA